jgi:hypothetical protein
MMGYKLHDIVQMKKNHPCRQSEHWEIVRMGVDIKIKCLGCGALIMFERPDFEKKLKKIVKRAENND